MQYGSVSRSPNLPQKLLHIWYLFLCAVQVPCFVPLSFKPAHGEAAASVGITRAEMHS